MTRNIAIFASRIFGPFCPAVIGNPDTYYQTAENKGEHTARHYRALRKRGYGATAAFKRALALPARYLPGYADGWDSSGGLGAPWQVGRTTLQWAERPAAIGLRFVAWADEIRGSRIDHKGWFNRDDSEHTALRAGVWRLPHGRLVPGYAEVEGGEPVNGESAALAFGEMIREDGGSEDDDSTVIDCARAADEIARIVAEGERESDAAYQAGAAAARRIAEAEEGRADAREALAALKAEKRRLGADMSAIIPRTLLATVTEYRRAMDEAREERDSAWGACPSSLESDWRAGYCDESSVDAWNAFAKGRGLMRFNGEIGDGLILPRKGAENCEECE